jgi:hypothetical protein
MEGIMSKEEMLGFFMDSFEKDPHDIFELLKTKAGVKLTIIMTGYKKISKLKKLLPDEIMRIQYGYCAYMILSKENGRKFAKNWLLKGGIYLRDSALAIRRCSSDELFLVMHEVMNCIRASHGIIS